MCTHALYVLDGVLVGRGLQPHDMPAERFVAPLDVPRQASALVFMQREGPGAGSMITLVVTWSLTRPVEQVNMLTTQLQQTRSDTKLCATGEPLKAPSMCLISASTEQS